MANSTKKKIIYVDQQNLTFIKRQAFFLILIGIFYFVGGLFLFIKKDITMSFVLFGMFFLYIAVGIIFLCLIKRKEF